MNGGDPTTDLSGLPRYLPEVEFPPYAYVPGLFPHPVADPTGHSFGVEAAAASLPDPERWQTCREYLHGIDLFNHGYYWESHEEWESLWHACGRTGTTALFLKALIKLAAAGVKVREGRTRGVQSHAQRAAELFGQVADEVGPNGAKYMGLNLPELVRNAEAAAQTRVHEASPETVTVAIAFDFVLCPV